jgi:hypothetical protein
LPGSNIWPAENKNGGEEMDPAHGVSFKDIEVDFTPSERAAIGRAVEAEPGNTLR